MRYLTSAEAGAWVRVHGVAQDERGLPHDNGDGLFRMHTSLPPAHSQLLYFSRFISGCLEPRSECLLWVTQAGIWGSSENWHLYYRLRQSYLDHRLLEEAPGHLFLNFEEHDLVSFLYLGILAGWDMWLVPRLAYGEADTARVFVSHDEYVAFFHRGEYELARWRIELEEARCRILS